MWIRGSPLKHFPVIPGAKIVCIVRSFAELDVREGTQEHTEWDRFVAHGRRAWMAVLKGQ